MVNAGLEASAVLCRGPDGRRFDNHLNPLLEKPS